MSSFSRLSLHLLIITTTLLALSTMQAEADRTMMIANLDQFRAVQPRCVLRRVKGHTIEIDDNCHVTVETRKCIGNCPSWTDVILGPPHFVKHCSCCQASKIIYEVKMAKCHEPKSPERFTGKTVKISVPTELGCACVKCNS